MEVLVLLQPREAAGLATCNSKACGSFTRPVRRTVCNEVTAAARKRDTTQRTANRRVVTSTLVGLVAAMAQADHHIWAVSTCVFP